MESSHVWQEAVSKYLASLSPAQQAAFKAPATADQCIQVLVDNCSRKRGFTRILQIFRPLIEPLKRFEGAIDAIVQINSSIASPIWGPLRLAITLIHDSRLLAITLKFIVDVVASSIQRYLDFEALFGTHESVQKAIGDLYCDLLDFCASVVAFHTRSIRSLFSSFEKQFRSIDERIRFHNGEVDREAAAAHMKEAKEAREKFAAQEKAHKLHLLQTWLCPSTVEDDLRKHANDYKTGSLDWIFTSKEYRDWSNAPSCSILRVIGPPGCGKSTLGAFLVQHWQNQCLPVLYFFWNDDDAEKSSFTSVVRTLLSQLLRFYPDLVDQIFPLYQQNEGPVAESAPLLEAFEKAMALRRGRVIHVVLDSIGSSRDEEDLQRLFESCLGNTKSMVVATMRGAVNDADMFSESYYYRWRTKLPSQTLLMRPEFASSHIRNYALHRVQQHLSISGNTGLAKRVVYRVSKSSDGLWLHARLMLDCIERAPSKERVVSSLLTLPSELSDLYAEVIRACEERMSQDQKQFAKYLFAWIDVHDYMPYFLCDRYDSLPYQTLQLVFRFVNGGNEVFDAAALAQEIGSPLIEVRRLNSTFEINFSHKTAHECFADIDEYVMANSPSILKGRQCRELYRGATAAWFFTDCPDSAKLLASLREDGYVSPPINTYFEMAYGLWNIFRLHVLPVYERKEDAEEPHSLLDQVASFLRDDNALRWFEMSTIINYTGNHAQLLNLVMEVLEACNYSLSSSHSLIRPSIFHKERHRFFLNWAYILQETTPWCPRQQSYLRIKKPEGFDGDLNATCMFHIARRWGTRVFGDLQNQKQLLSSTQDDSEFSIVGSMERTSDLVVCAHCLKGVPEDALKAHLVFNCKASAVRKCEYCLEKISGRDAPMHFAFHCDVIEQAEARGYCSRERLAVCDKCSRIIQKRDMNKHLRFHSE